MSRPLVLLAVLAAVLVPVGVGPLGTANAETQPTANADGSYTVPHDWALIPAGVLPGNGFRLLFVTSTVRDATSTDIADYNTHVQNAAARAGAHTAIRPYASAFKALGCTATVNGRDNTGSTAAVGVPVFWLNGDKLASSYDDFYDGYWDSNGPSAPKDESGATHSGTRVFTGCGDAGTKTYRDLGDTIGTTIVGDPWRAIGFSSMYRTTASSATSLPFYGLSPLFVVEGYDPHSLVPPPERFDISTLSDASPPGLIFRVCPDGATCDPAAPDDDPTWVPTLNPQVVVREGQGPVAYQFKVIGRKHGTYETRRWVSGGRLDPSTRRWINPHWETYQQPYSPWRSVDVRPQVQGNYYTLNGSNSRTRLQCSQDVGHVPPRQACTRTKRNVSFANRNNWQTITLIAGHDSDASDHSVYIDHSTRTLAVPSSEYGYHYHQRMAGVGNHRDPRVYVTIIDDEEWFPEIEVLGHGKADVDGNWIGLNDGGLHRSLPAVLAHDTEYEIKLRLRRINGVAPSASALLQLNTDRSQAVRVWVHDAGGHTTEKSKNAGLSPEWLFWTKWQWSNASLGNHPPPDQVVTVRLLAPQFRRGTVPGTPEGQRIRLRAVVKDSNNGLKRHIVSVPSCVGGCGSGPTVAEGPTVDITNTAGTVEGGDVSFSLAADPAPAAPLDVSVTVTSEGDYGVTPGTRTVVVGTDGVGTIDLSTDDDEVAESNGSVTLRVNPSSGYVVGSEAVSTAPVEDDDSWPVVTIAGSRAIVEGESARFTLTKTPATGDSVTVNLAVSEDGDWGASGPSTFKFSGGIGYYDVSTVDDEAYDNPGSVKAALAEGYGYRVGSPGSSDVAVTDTDVPPRTPLVQFASVVESFYDRITANHVHGNSASGALNKRFLKTMGHPEYVDYPQPTLTVADAERLYNHGGPGANTAWEGAPEAIQYKLDYDAGLLVPEPELTISGGSPITEGGTATFTITADPAPATPITVNMDVDEDGSWDASGDATVTVSGATTTYTITTTDDDVDEPDGSVTAKLKFGYGYQLGSPSSAAVDVADDDDAALVDPLVKYASLIKSFYDRITANHVHGYGFSGGWNKRFLKAMGHPEYVGHALPAATVADAERLYNHGGPGANKAWEGTAEAIQYKLDYDDRPVDPPPATEPELTISGGPAITEGATATFTITADPAPTDPITVNMDVDQDGSWGAAGPATVTVSGATTTYSITTTDDDVFEPDGSVTATVEAGTGYTVGADSAATVKVSNNDPPAPSTPKISIEGGPAITEGGTATFTITADPAPTSPVTVNIDVSEVGDWDATGPSIVTVSGATATYTITTSDDSIDEPNGSVTATVLAGQGYRLAFAYRATVAVSDDDLPVPELTITAGSAITEGQTATFTITASPTPEVPVTVNIGVSEVGDWDATGPTTVTVNSATTIYSITTSDDEQDELDGSVTATLRSGAGYTLGSASSATLNVSDDDFGTTTGTGNADTLEVKFNDASPAQRGQTLRFKITLSETAQQNVEISYFIRFDRMSKPSGPDTGLLTIPTGADHGYINIQIPANTQITGSNPRVRIGMEDIRGAQDPSWTDAIAYGKVTG